MILMVRFVNMRKCIYISLGFLLIFLIVIDFIFSENILVQKYIPNFVAEIFGIILVVAFVDQLLRAERKRETERFQQHQRIKTTGLNIRSIPDENENRLRMDFRKLWELGGLAEQEYRKAAMDELFWISIFLSDEVNKATLLAEAVKNQFLELAGPEYVSFDDQWKEDLIRRGIDVLEWIGCNTKTIYSKNVFTQVQNTIQSFFDIAIAYGKEKIAVKCFETLETLEKCIRDNRDRSEITDKEWREYQPFTAIRISDMKKNVKRRIKEKGYNWSF